ncbi:MAG: hypothetical protein HYX40_01650 [Sphingobacteriales bacterium]|nr:hypothetical protein [Sphingobacteriales bacterium]
MHGFPRYTGDMDIWIERSEVNAIQMLKVVDGFGFASLNMSKEDFMKKDYVTQLGFPPLRIDILNDLANVPFKEAWDNREVKTIANTNINFIGLKELLNAKKAAGRQKDLEDIKRLKKRNKLK